MFVNSNHAGNKRTRRSRAGFMICMNMSLFTWYSKKQPTIKAQVSGTEFVAMNIRVDKFHTIQYETKKKCNIIAYHATCKSVMMTESLAYNTRSENSPADLLAKVISRQKRKNCM